MRNGLLKRLRRWLYLGHRWLGIVTCLFFATWFVSGLVMMYVAFPALTEAERLGALAPLSLDRAAVQPSHALAGEARFPRDLRLEMLDAEPVYRIVGWDGTRRTVSAIDGRGIDTIATDAAVAIARRDPRAVRPKPVGMVDRDQWSVTARYDPLRPFHRIALGDPAGTELYVSVRAGEVALDTNRHERVWNWFGAIPHWLYLTPLRAKAELWRDVVLWVSGIAIAGAVSGFWIGMLRVRPRRRYPSGAATPYRGWAAWHHVAGLAGGAALIAFIVSGWLSMNPNRWFGPRTPSPEMLQHYAGAPGPAVALDLDQVRAMAGPESVEVRFVWLAGQSHTIVVDRGGRRTSCCEAGVAGLDRVLAAAERLLPDAKLSNSKLIEKEDDYWYSHHQQRRLPVLRVAFDDAAATWFHIDPDSGEVLGRLDRSGRSYRWLFNAAHSLDFRILRRHRPAWDALVWLLSAAGLVISISGIVMGWRRLW